ncbi:putative surface protein with fasciclin (FAS1) repeats [Chitinophaga dinghuensis]|uniref:Putative surface protein with fasciclin (FAS1) repeats n=1 Tax=Chitinophaga dinghuensis TaxID=1539050 RepID=A0A327VKI2_9BACT|nr:fasciclin domain-containing protein [Chitinophaga dinghuensis]RAJ73705.1 putative surface protein with fasciclin (FAS1) repeats [Chitinophaga dinghuensis]
MKKHILSATLLLSLFACKKDKEEAAPASDSNNLLYVIEDNKFNFSYFNTALTVTNFGNTLTTQGPLTVLIPDNSAFQRAGYNSIDMVSQESGIVLQNMVQYHTLNGRWQLDKLPFRFNQQITTVAGTQLFVTHWVKDKDTIITINGTRVTAQNMPASNGLIQVINAVMQPLTQDKISDAVAADPSLTFFNAALQQADMKTLLRGDGPFTIFAPNNTAFKNAGFPSTDSIRNTDPAVLKSILQFHILNNRRFVYDYVLSTGQSNTSSQTMLNNSTTTVNLLYNGVDYTGITIQGAGNTSPCQLLKSNVLANNGVLHVIDKLLMENF